MKNAILAGVHSIEHSTLLDHEAAALMTRHGVFMVPTLSALATTADNGLGCGIPSSVVTKARNMRARHESSFKKAHRAGIRIALGTDAGTPFNYHGDNAQELDRMVALGLTPLEAIHTATAEAAELLGIQDKVGTLEKSKQADLILVEGNPLKKISLLQRPDRFVGVMQAGTWVGGKLKED